MRCVLCLRAASIWLFSTLCKCEHVAAEAISAGSTNCNILAICCCYAMAQPCLSRISCFVQHVLQVVSRMESLPQRSAEELKQDVSCHGPLSGALISSSQFSSLQGRQRCHQHQLALHDLRPCDHCDDQRTCLPSPITLIYTSRQHKPRCPAAVHACELQSWVHHAAVLAPHEYHGKKIQAGTLCHTFNLLAPS